MTTARRASLTAAAIITTALLAACDPASSTPTTTAGNPAAAATTDAASAAIKSWYTTTGQSIVTTVAGDVSKTAGDASNPTAVKADCKTFAADINSAQSGAPLPDPTEQAAWASALTELAKGAADCGSGDTSTGINEIAQASTDLTTVTIRISTLVGQ